MKNSHLFEAILKEDFDDDEIDLNDFEEEDIGCSLGNVRGLRRDIYDGAYDSRIRYVIKGIFKCNGKEKIFYYNKSLDNWSKYLVNPDPTQLANATLFKNVPKDETLEAASDAANNRKRCAVRFEDPEYELVEIIILELLKDGYGRYGFSRVSQRSWPDGKHESLSDSVIQKEENKIMEKLFENILNESRKGPELQFIVSSYISKDGREKWRIEEDDKFDEAIGIGHNVRFRLSELKDLIYSLPDKIIEYRNATTEYDDVIKHECYLKEIRKAFHEALIVKYNTTFIYRSVKSEGYVELYILLDYDSFEKYLNE